MIQDQKFGIKLESWDGEEILGIKIKILRSKLRFWLNKVEVLR